jgi:hypothetical protein
MEHPTYSVREMTKGAQLDIDGAPRVRAARQQARHD